MTSPTEFSELIGTIYDAGMNPRLWPHVLDRIAHVLGGMRADLWVGAPSGDVRAVDFIGIDPAFRRTYEQHFGRIDPVFWPVTTLPEGTMRTDAVIPRTNLEHSEFYQDWVRPQDMHSIAVVNFLHTDSMSGVLGLPRSARGRPFGSDDLRLFKALLPHLRRAVQIGMHLGTLAARERLTSAALDRLSRAILIVDRQSRPLFLNRAAQQLLRRRDGLSINGNLLGASTNRLTQMLHVLVARATSTTAEARGSALALLRPSGKRALNAFVSRLPCESSWPCVPDGAHAALILISDDEPGAVVSEDVLMDLYGLTRAEARVAGRLGRGETLTAVADSLGVLASTARTHLHHTFEKTATQRQSELVRLVEQAAVLADQSNEELQPWSR